MKAFELKINKILLIIVLLVALLNEQVYAQPATSRYCGLYAVYAAATLHGIELEFSELVKPEYLGTPSGSRLSELIAALDQIGLQSMPVKQMTLDTLSGIPYPAIVSVRFDALASEFNHFELFVRTQGESVLLIDSEGRLKQESFTDFAARWSGVGLLVSDTSIKFRWFGLSSIGRTIFHVVLGLSSVLLCVVLFNGGVKRRFRRFSLANFGTQAVSLSGLALLLGLASGTWANPSSVIAGTGSMAYARIVKEYENRIPIISAAALKRYRDAVIIDARAQSDYASGHVPGALNIPPGAGGDTYNSVFARLPRQTKVILYCQSAGCPYAESTGKNVIAMGFQDVSHYKNGWVEWKRLFPDAIQVPASQE